MRRRLSGELSPSVETQLEAIRELMLSLSSRGAWLTLAEIAEQTEIGEASISAQLRHLRKPRHGRYKVEKRPRRLANPGVTGGGNCLPSSGPWEYRVLPPALSHRAQMTNGRDEGEPIRARVEVTTSVDVATGEDDAKTRD